MIKIKDFAEQHNITPDNIWASIRSGKIPKRIIKDGYLDETFFTKRKDFKSFVIDYNQAIYYELLDNMRIKDIAEYMASKTKYNYNDWRTWMSSLMWSVDKDTITLFKVPLKHYLFYRHIRHI